MRIVVAGGGPAGCIAAKAAASCGGNATVYEEHCEPGKPVQCSGLVSKKGLDLLGIRYSGSVLNEITGAEIIAPGATVQVVANGAKAFVIDRSKFDSICALEAENAGAKVILGERAPDIGAGEILVGADGVFSRTAKAFGFPENKRLVACYQAEFSRASPKDRNAVSVYLSRHSPGFFGWVIPVNEETVRVGLGVSLGKNPKEHFDAFARELRGSVLCKAKQESSLAGFIPLAPRRETVRGRVALVGDAAGQVKALSGGGIYFGCSCASIAGRIAALSPESMHSYEKEWRAAFGKDLMLHQVMRSALDFFPLRLTGAAMAAGNLFGAERFLVRYGDMDRPTEMARAVKEDSDLKLGKCFNNITSGILGVLGSGGNGSSGTRGDNP